MPFSAGKRLGSYEILATIGVGGMGEVYKARDTRLDRIVAIKVLPEHVSGDADLKQRFEREAKAISSLTHPHICTLYDVGSDAGVEFLVMEYLEGETAAQRLAKGPIPLQQALRFGVEIAEALERAHRQGVTHRDLKPANVMLTKTGAKLLDFGLAKLKPIVLERGTASAPTLAPDLTGSGTILGTLQYMAPEQVEGAAVDHRADIFALGAILYEMATGKKAFDGRSQASLIGSILRDEPRPISELQPLSPPALDALVATCLAKDPDERWQSAADVGRQLRLMQGSSPPRALTGEHAGESARAAHARGNRAAWAIAAAAIAVAATFALLYVLREEPVSLETHVDIVTPPTSDSMSFAISPDGRRLVFVAGQQESKRLWVRSLDSANAAPLLDTEGATWPFWSPNSRSIGFFAGGKLKRIDLDGGRPRVLADASEARGGTWNNDDVILFSPAPGQRLQRISAAGGDIATAVPGVSSSWSSLLV
jgi:eukaryotic-like serine/threonine-protein kinase